MKIALFVVGLLLAIAGFLGDRAESFPSVMRLVSPDYIAARAGLDALGDARVLRPNDDGFAALTILFSDEFAKSDESNRKVLEIIRGGDKLYPDGRLVKFEKPVAFVFGLNSYASVDYSALEKAVDERKTSSLLWLSGFIFGLGVLLSILAFVWELREQGKDAG